MANIKQATTDILLTSLLNLGLRSGEMITYLGSGSHGIGKTQSIKELVERLNTSGLCEAHCDTIEGGSLKEGELTGYPIVVNEGAPRFDYAGFTVAYNNAKKLAEQYPEAKDVVKLDSFVDAMVKSFTKQDQKVEFALYNKIATIRRVQEYVYNSVKKGVTLRDGRTIHIDDDGNTILNTNGEIQILESKTEFEKIKLGELNRYSFGEELPKELKLELLMSKVVPFYFLLIDEINRSDDQTFKEMMNFILNREMNGYKLPWWVNIVAMMNPSSLNSSYNVRSMDGAQMSRFNLNPIKPVKSDWGLNELNKKGANGKYVHAVMSQADNLFNHEDQSQEETTVIFPNPRSHSIAAYIEANTFDAMMLPFFTKDEQEPRYIEETKLRLITGAIGKSAAETILSAIKSDRQYVPAEDILTAKSPTISKAVKEKLAIQDTITRSFTIDLVLSYICKTFYGISERAKDPRDEEARKELYNYASQFDEYVNSLDEQGVANLANRITLRPYKIYDDAGCEVPNKRLLSLLIGCPVLGRDQKGTFQKIIETYQGIRNVNL